MVSLPDRRHMKEGIEPYKWIWEKDKESKKADSSLRYMDSKVDILAFLSPRASDTISYGKL